MRYCAPDNSPTSTVGPSGQQPLLSPIMDWSDLHFALAVARAGSVLAAADQLGVAHTTVYRRIARIEKTYGKLFDRRLPGDPLTPLGRELLLVGQDIEAKVDALERSFRTHDPRPSGRVSLAAVESMAVAITRHLATFRHRHPTLTLSLTATNRLLTVGQDVDIALRLTRAPRESLVGRKVATIAFAVYAHKELGNEDLSTLPFVCFDESLGRSPQGRWESQHVSPERVALQTNVRAVFMQALASGVGAGVAQCGLASENPDLIAMSSVIEELSLPLWLLTHAELAKEPRVRTVMDYLTTALAAERGRLEGRPG